MHNQKQFETMAIIRAYAVRILAADAGDCRPSTAKYNYADAIARMVQLVKDLDIIS